MTLDEWRSVSGLTWSDIAELICCSKPYPGMISKGKAHPSFKMACRIEEISNGLVPRTNWYPDANAPVGKPGGKSLLED